MKNIIRKLICYSFLGIASVLCFNADARVTKEVAEAALPYLMEFAKIPEGTGGDVVQANEGKYAKNKINAILNMIYTDKGQQQMVNWVQKGEFPELLKDGGFESTGIYRDEPYRKASLGSLFPCTTDTFTSFTNHSSRLGKHVLGAPGQAPNIINQLFSFRKNDTQSPLDAIVNNMRSISVSSNLDSILAKIIFILDIFDSKDQICDIFKACNDKTLKNLKDKFSKKDIIASKSEYQCRPVSAIQANDTGDCVETLYRHLINIAIQDTDGSLQIDKLPIPLRKFYDSDMKYQTIDAPKGGARSQAGLTSIERHKDWKGCLEAVSSNVIDCSIGSLCSIAKMIDYIANYEEKRVLDTTHANDMFSLSGLLENAMNKLADQDDRFTVNVPKKEEGKERELGAPSWCSTIITIEDTIIARTIRIGICEKLDKSYGHAEILTIEPHNEGKR